MPEQPPRYRFDFSSSEIIDVDAIAAELGELIVPIVFRYAGQLPVNQGSGFCLLATQSREMVVATARHVVEELLDSPTIEPMVVLPTARDRRALTAARVTQVALAESFSDVALLVVDLQSAVETTREPKPMRVSFGEPKVGEPTMALGYSPSNTIDHAEGNLSYHLHASRGHIEEIHNPHRDTSLSTFPSFRTNADYPSGMSGGPIIDSYGLVIGIVSHSMREEPPIGYGACFAGMAEIKVDLKQDDGQVRELSVSELAQTGAIAAGPSPVELQRDGFGVTLRWPEQVE